MSMSTEETKVLAKLRNRSTGSFDRLKDQEARAGGRRLPGGIEEGTAIITGAKLGESQKSGDPYVYVYATAETPEECKGVPCGIIYMLNESQYATYNDNLLKLFNDMKLLGMGDIITSAEDELDAVTKIVANLKDTKLRFSYNTGTRKKKDGTYSFFVQSLSDDQEVASDAVETTPEAKAPTSPACPFALTDNVITTGDFFEDGTNYTGTVSGLDTGLQICEVLFDDDGSTSKVPWGNLRKTGASESGEVPFDDSAEPEGFQQGDAVSVKKNYFGDGLEYTGTIIEIDEESATVLFDDGEKVEIPLDDLSPGK